MKIHSITDKMPETYETVLAIRTYKNFAPDYFLAYYDGRVWCGEGTNGLTVRFITHWMKLPTPAWQEQCI